MPELVWYRHRDSGTPHGFTLPLHEDLQAQVKKGHLQPCDPPEHVRTVFLTPEQERQLAGDDLKESKKERKARLLAELAALGDDEDDQEENGDEPGSDVVVPDRPMAAEPAGTTTRPRAGRSAGKP